MHTTIGTNRLSHIVTRAAAVLFSVVATLCLQAQQPAASPQFNLKAILARPLNLGSSADLTYSSSLGTTALVDTESSSIGAEGQPPPRRPYSRRTNYSDKMHNADGSNKLTFEGGGGFTVPTGSSGHELSTSWRFRGGVRLNFNKKFALMAQYDYDKFGLTDGALNRQYIRYNALHLVDQNGHPLSFAGLDGNAHIWSLTINPIYTFYQSDSVGAYVVGGGGFYRKLTNFTLPQTGVYCDFFGFCYAITQNQTFDHYSNNAGGINGGLGLTYRFSRFATEKLFAEARYVWVDNSQSTNSVGGLYPENNKRTGYFPVTLGIRW